MTAHFNEISKMPSFNPTFTALLKEAEFTSEMLGAGATQIRCASYAKKGIYFQSFSSLATGLERIGKLCLMLDFYIDNDGGFPDFEYLKKSIGHDLSILYAKSQLIVERRSIPFEYLPDLSSPIHGAIVQCLSDFAKGDRYSNLNLLVSNKRKSDPIAAWARDVDAIIFSEKVSAKSKSKIQNNSAKVSSMLADHAIVWHLSEDGTEITDVGTASAQGGIFSAVAPLRQLHVLHVIRYWVELLNALSWAARALGRQEIPYVLELFGHFYNDDSLLRSRKVWYQA